MLFRYALHCHVLPMQGALHHALRGETEVTVDSSLQDPPIEYTICLYIYVYKRITEVSVMYMCTLYTHQRFCVSVMFKTEQLCCNSRDKTRVEVH